MPTKKQIADTLKERFADVAERGKVIGQALRVRAEMAAARRRLRRTYAELGEEVYGRLRAGSLEGDHRLLTLKERLDGLQAEVRTLEDRLRDIVESGLHVAAGSTATPAEGEAAAPPAAGASREGHS